ncbi:hypothetical protein ACHAWF_004256 [Thalassiosira exigua]
MPWKMQPIVCSRDTLITHLSWWLDYQFSKLKPHVTTYLKDNYDILNHLKISGPLPSGAKPFTMAANPMYTNSDTNHVIAVIGA